MAAGRKDSLLRSVLHLGAIRLNNKEVKNKKKKKNEIDHIPNHLELNKMLFESGQQKAKKEKSSYFV